ncbi:M15 family metallopeptidase [Dysgonomonas sp. 520]|uniref:M15 family metallopeptidase n=1 Tax=Dysgonomonas sp. 520 TaxID=2302931 RepID=UPI0013D8DDED|nr:M15 family metallopeptidase [Dysgonomonas sp. 520]NDW10744.1 M15 family peptidase [Dysgonomonas sp. 520]
MRRFATIVAIFFSTICLHSQSYPNGVGKLMKAYPDFIGAYDGKNIVLKNGVKIIYDDVNRNKTSTQLLDNPSISDIFRDEYVKGEIKVPTKGNDAGRIRSEVLLKAMYGATSSEVQKNLITITWCPKLVGSKIKVTTQNGVDKQLRKVSEELDNHPELKKYLTGATTFNWRKIAGTNRLSSHSFGTAIDLNANFSNYWQWDCRCRNEEATLKYKNQIPQLIVDTFEKYGFIWGGRWYHYDTMHFEYRPELLAE